MSVNAIVYTVTAEILNSGVAAGADVQVTAQQTAPSGPVTPLSDVLEQKDFKTVEDYTNEIKPSEHASGGG